MYKQWIMALFLVVATYAAATDIIIVDAPQSEADRRNGYTDNLLLQILQKTEKKYGPYKLHHAALPMDRERLFKELKTGQLVNVSAQPSQPDWEKGLLPIWIPVDKGLSSYQIFLIRKDKQALFNAIRNLDTLKKKRLGADDSWSSYRVYQAKGFNVVAGENYEGMFQMLKVNRFDYFPRALYEAFNELEDRQQRFPTIGIENSLLLYFPQPKYFFVSPTQPRLAKRIQDGLEIMIADGSFDQAFMSYHQKIIEQTRFCERRLFKFDNPFLNHKALLKHKNLWFNPYQAAHKEGPNRPQCGKLAH